MHVLDVESCAIHRLQTSYTGCEVVQSLRGVGRLKSNDAAEEQADCTPSEMSPVSHFSQASVQTALLTML